MSEHEGNVKCNFHQWLKTTGRYNYYHDALLISLISTAVFTVVSKGSLSHLITDPFRDCILNVNLQWRNKFILFNWQLWFWICSLSYTLKEIVHHLFFFSPLFNAHSFLNFPGKMSRKGHSEVLHSGCFHRCWMYPSLLSVPSLSGEKVSSLLAALISLTFALSHLQLEHASKDQKKKELQDWVFS